MFMQLSRTMRSMTILIAFLISYPAFCEADKIRNELFPILMNWQIKNADVIVVAKINTVEAPVWKLGSSFYEIKLESAIKGTLEPGKPLSILWARYSSFGKPVVLPAESDSAYLLFLKNASVKSYSSDNKSVKTYELVDEWKGIIALSPNAKEKRAVENIKKWIEIDATEVPSAFVAAIAFRVEADGEKRNERTLDAESKKIYDALKLGADLD